MSEHRGHYRMQVEGLEGEALHRDPAEVGPSQGRRPEVRAIAPTADERAAGVQRYETTIDGWVFRVSVEDEPRALLRAKAGQGAEGSGRRGSDVVKAQIPGRVLHLWVTEGEAVEAGQRLLAIEAMKMENDVRAPHAGTIERIGVEAGGSVELGDELLRLS